MNQCLKISVIIVNYRSASLVCNALESLVPMVSDGEGVLVVDNASSDSSIEVISDFVLSRGWELTCRILPSHKNGGFSFGNNLGFDAILSAQKRPEYVLLLNPDTVVRDYSVLALMRFMDEHPQVGVAGSRLENSAGEQEASAHNFPSPLGELEAGTRLGMVSRLLKGRVVTPHQPLYAAPCDWVSGASMIIRTKVIEEIGLMDEGFFLYFEEVDFCKRAKAAGWECWYVPESRVMHLEGASTGIKEANKRRPRYWYDSRRRYFVKHHGVLGLVLADLLWATGRVTYLLRRALKLGAQGENRDPNLFMFDLLWGDLRAILSGNVFRIERFSK